MTKSEQKAIKKLQGNYKSRTIITAEEINFNRRVARFEKLTKRIKRNKARPEEIEEHNKLKKILNKQTTTFLERLKNRIKKNGI